MSTAASYQNGDSELHSRFTPKQSSTLQANVQNSSNGDLNNGNDHVNRFEGDEQQRAEARSRSRSRTPIPPNAPPSVQATSSARQQQRRKQRRKQFPSVEFAERVSHFDPASEHRDFRGFFVLFWIGLFIMVITTGARNVRETGYPFTFKQKRLFLDHLWQLAYSDAAMLASTALSLPLHRLFASSNSFLRWSKGGIWIQSAFEAAWLFNWVNWPFLLDWGWTAQVFLTLHVLTLFMKMHSYAFYNGHLSEMKRQLDALDRPLGVPVRKKLVRYPSSSRYIEHLSPKQVHDGQGASPEETLNQRREDLAFELTSPMGNISYPNNLTLANFADFVCCPTLCYEIEYPRTEGIRWMELFYKTLAVFGCVFLLILISEEFIMPVLAEAAGQLQLRETTADGALIFAETISRLLFPFMVTFLLVFLVIFEYLLGAFAELTCFADRHFYSDWWNSTDWSEFYREWNIPVHAFMRRHVYSASQGLLSRPGAMLLTFFISALFHELIMGCITKKLRGYGAAAMMLQIPILAVQRSPPLKNRALLNNILFWISMIFGLAVMCALYVLA